MKKFVFIFLAFFFFSPPASAMTVVSPLLEMEAEPGSVQSGVLKLYNETDVELPLTSQVEPFAAGDEAGQPKYLAPEEKDSYLKWFKVGQDSIVLKPRQAALIPFTVTVPADAFPGGYYAAIFWQEKPTAPANAQVSIASRVGTLIFLKVKGEVKEKGEVAEFTTSAKSDFIFSFPVNFIVRFSNFGNIHLAPAGTIEIKNWFGQTETLQINADKRLVLPASIRRFEAVWVNEAGGGNIFYNFYQNLKKQVSHRAFGRYEVTLRLDYGADRPQQTREIISFWFFPWQLITVILSVIITLYILFRLVARMKRQRDLADKLGQ